jgi:hypothetical protein
MLFPRLRIKRKEHHFDMIAVIDAELQKVLNILIVHDFKDAFQNGRNSGNGALSPELVFYQMAVPIPQIKDQP